jgi:signal transduction histidine kinase
MEKLRSWRSRSSVAPSTEIRFQAGANLITHLQRVMEQEKGRVAKFLHDELGALIVAAIMDIECTESHLESGDLEGLRKLSRARQALRAAIDMERKLIDDLRPTLLDDVGLFAALRWQLKRTWGGAGVISTERYPAVELQLRPDALIGLFRIAQEALQMSLNHKLVKSASLTVTVHQDKLSMRFVDDGITAIVFTPLEGGGNALTSMRNRLRILGGRVQITEPTGGGTILLASVPLSAALAS